MFNKDLEELKNKQTEMNTIAEMKNTLEGIRWEGGSGWGIHVYPWLIHVNVSQKPLQYCKVISLQLIKKKLKNKKKEKEKYTRRNE